MKKIFIKIIMICLILTYSNAVENNLNFSILVSDDVESFDFNKVKREYIYEERASAVLIVYGFSTNKSNKVDLSSKIRVLTPENNYIAEMNIIKSTDTIEKGQKKIPLNGIYDLYFESNDPLGTYWLEVTITDNISKKSMTKKISILLFDNKRSKELTMKKVQSSKHLDDLWEDYFRSKNPWAIKRIISTLNYINSKNKKAVIIGSAAKLSLKSNSMQYKEVLKICKNSLKSVPNSIKHILEDIILTAEKNRKE